MDKTTDLWINSHLARAWDKLFTSKFNNGVIILLTWSFDGKYVAYTRKKSKIAMCGKIEMKVPLIKNTAILNLEVNNLSHALANDC